MSDRRIAVAIFALYFLLNLPGLTRSPIVWIDEPRLNDPARVLASEGRLRADIFADSAGFDQRFMWHPPGHMITMAAAYKLFGFGIWQTRLVGLLFTALATALIYLIAKQLWQRTSAGLLAVVMSTPTSYFLSLVRVGRMDGQGMFLVCAALLATLYWLRKGKAGLTYPVIAGVLAGLACTVHAASLSWVLALFVILLWRGGWRASSAFGIASAIAPAAWLLWALQTPDLFREQFLGHAATRNAGGWFVLNGLRQLYERVPLLAAAHVLGLIYLARNRSIQTHIVALLILITLLIDVLITSRSVYGYLLLAVALGFAAAPALSQRANSQALDRLRIAFLALLILNVFATGLVGRLAVAAREWDARNPARVDSLVRATIPPGSSVIGDAASWYGVINAGGVLRVFGRPDARQHDYVIAYREFVPEGYCKIGENPAAGRYDLVVWASRLRVPERCTPSAAQSRTQ